MPVARKSERQALPLRPRWGYEGSGRGEPKGKKTERQKIPNSALIHCKQCRAPLREAKRQERQKDSPRARDARAAPAGGKGRG